MPTVATAQPTSPQEVIVIGNTILSTAGARHIPTGLLRTGLAVLLEAIPSRTGRRTHARTRPDNNLRAATGEAWVIDNSPAEAIAAQAIETRPTAVPEAIAALVIEIRPTVVLGVAIRTTEEGEGIALAIDKSRTPGARRTGARLVEHLPA